MNAVLLALPGVSLLLAGFMSAIAWGMTREERRRSDARVAALSSEIYEDLEDEHASSLFHDRAAPSSARYAIAAVLGVCVVAAVAGVAVVTTRSSQHRQTRRGPAATTSSRNQCPATPGQPTAARAAPARYRRHPADHLENQQLREQLEAAAKVTTIASKTIRPRRPNDGLV